MDNALKVLFLIISGLFPIVDPLSESPLFLVFTKNYPADVRMALSKKVAFNSFYLIFSVSPRVAQVFA